MSPMLYPRMKSFWKKRPGFRFWAMCQKLGTVIESRTSWSGTSGRDSSASRKITELAKILEDTLEIDEILQACRWCIRKFRRQEPRISFHLEKGTNRCAEDEAFCFNYKDNFRLLKSMGAELVTFSPMRDVHLPENLKGLILGGGYRNLMPRSRSECEHAGRICAVHWMMECRVWQNAVALCIFMMRWRPWMEMAIIWRAWFPAELIVRRDWIVLVTWLWHRRKKFGNEWYGWNTCTWLHYFDSENCGDDFDAKKPASHRKWNCIHGTDTMMAGFPHLYFYGNPKVPEAFLRKCSQYGRQDAR